jgi:hypothetical protein
MTATDFFVSSGSVLLELPGDGSFLSRTIERPAALSAAARSSGFRKLAGSTALAWST